MLNFIAIQGRMVSNPELKTTQSGVSVCSFRIACERSFASNGQRVSDFFNVVAWRGTAEFISKYFTKGQLVVINGELQSREYNDTNGNKRTVIEIIASGANFCGKEQNVASAKNVDFVENVAKESGFDVVASDEDLPF